MKLVLHGESDQVAEGWADADKIDRKSTGVTIIRVF